METCRIHADCLCKKKGSIKAEQASDAGLANGGDEDGLEALVPVGFVLVVRGIIAWIVVVAQERSSLGWNPRKLDVVVDATVGEVPMQEHLASKLLHCWGRLGSEVT